MTRRPARALLHFGVYVGASRFSLPFPRRRKPHPRRNSHFARSGKRAREILSSSTLFSPSMPKGTDLHIHLTGAVYAETMIRDAAEDQLCADPSALAFAKPEHKSKDDAKGPACDDRQRPRLASFQRPASLRRS